MVGKKNAKIILRMLFISGLIMIIFLIYFKLLQTKETDQPQIKIPQLERSIHNFVNLERQNFGLHKLALNNKIAFAARAHSQDMAEKDYFGHKSPDGINFYDWYRNSVRSGWRSSCAENIYQDWLAKAEYGQFDILNSEDELAKKTVSAWMNSKPHRMNLLSKQWSEEGIGVAISGGKVYVTENFC